MLNTRELLSILMLKGVGRKSAQRLLAVVDRPNFNQNDTVDLFLRARSKGLRVQPPTQSDLFSARARADRVISTAETMGISIIGYNDRNFPLRLKHIPDPPVILYFKGDHSCFSDKVSIAVIGTRNPSSLGLELADRYSSYLASKGVIIISGLALGCDSAAHSACLEEGGRAVAVLAHGLDTVYPASNTRLAEAIIETGGCLVSEYPPGVRPQKQSFVDRDRLQSGLSDSVLVIQSGVSGGTMHTARFARKQQRPVLAVRFPDQIADDRTDGNRKLIDMEGAIPVESTIDLDAFLITAASSPSAYLPPVGDDENSEEYSEGQMNLFDKQ